MGERHSITPGRRHVGGLDRDQPALNLVLDVRETRRLVLQRLGVVLPLLAQAPGLDAGDRRVLDGVAGVGEELLGHALGVAPVDAEDDLQPGVAEDEGLQRLRDLGERLVRQHQREPVLTGFREKHAEVVAGEVLELIDIQVEGPAQWGRGVGAREDGQLQLGEQQRAEEIGRVLEPALVELDEQDLPGSMTSRKLKVLLGAANSTRTRSLANRALTLLSTGSDQVRRARSESLAKR